MRNIIFCFIFSVLSIAGVSQIIPDLSMVNLYVGQDYDDVIKELGKTLDTCVINSNKVRYESSFQDTLEGVYYNVVKPKEAREISCYCNKELGIQIRFKNSKITSITFLKNSFETIKGVKIGDNKRKLLKIYGDNYESFSYTRNNYPYFEKGIHYPELGLKFYFDYEKKNKIIEINFTGV